MLQQHRYSKCCIQGRRCSCDKGACGLQVLPEVWHEVTQAAHALVRAGRAPEEASDQQQLQEMATYVRSGHSPVAPR